MKIEDLWLSLCSVNFEIYLPACDELSRVEADLIFFIITR